MFETKLSKWKSSKLRAESFQLLSFDKLQVLGWNCMFETKLLKVECWILSNIEGCQILKLLNIESCQSVKLKVVESVECWKFVNCKNLLSTNKFSKAFIL